MNIWNCTRHALHVSAATAILAGCSNANPQLTPLVSIPQGDSRSALNAVSENAASASTDSGISLFGSSSPQTSMDSFAKKKRALLYISDGDADVVFMYRYPSLKFVYALTGFKLPRGECRDAHDDVFIVDEWVPEGTSKIYEYAHGGKNPIATLSDYGSAGEFAYGCSVNPLTGDLAVSSAGTSNSSIGSVSIYKKARGAPKVYSDSNLAYGAQFLAYDPKGNIFIDGINSAKTFELDELPVGSSKFTRITLKQNMGFPAGVQWVANTLAVGSSQAPQASTIYEFSINGSVGTVVGSTQLTGSTNIVQFFVQDNTIIGPDAAKEDVGFWNYPVGGTPTKTIEMGLREPIGAVISE
jgi:hypothetical protein